MKMFTEVKNLIFNPNHCMSSRYFIGIIETKADSSFLIHHFLSYFLKENLKVVFLSFRQSFNHFNSVGNKIGNSLSLATERKQFCFIEGLKSLALAVNGGILTGESQWKDAVVDQQVCVEKLYALLKHKIWEHLSNTDEKVVLIIDDITTLLDIGVLAPDCIALVHYLQHLVHQEIGGTLVVGCSNDLRDADEERDVVKKYLQHSVDQCLEVSGLETGYCKDVHGQLTVSWNNYNSREKQLKRVTQYKLTDKNCAIFASGMSSAVL